MAGGKRAASYESDDGFVEDAPRSKKAKPASSKATTSTNNGSQDASWELDTEYKRVSLGTFNSKTLINIREYYTDKSSGELKPGKKGIALTVASYKALLAAIPEINWKLEEMGESVGGISGGGGVSAVAGGEDAEGIDLGNVVKEKRKRTEKSNIEETSDEEE